MGYLKDSFIRLTIVAFVISECALGHVTYPSTVKERGLGHVSTYGSLQEQKYVMGPPVPFGNWVCYSVGECAPCSVEQRDSPSCQPFGNRRPLLCSNKSVKHDSYAKSGDKSAVPVKSTPKDETERLGLDPDPQAIDDEQIADNLRGDRPKAAALQDKPSRFLDRRESDPSVDQEIRAWEACPKVVEKERADFFEFVMCNLFFAATSLITLAWRHRKLAVAQYGRLAARIGVNVNA